MVLIRIYKEVGPVFYDCNSPFKKQRFGIMGFVVPLTGWGTNYKFVGPQWNFPITRYVTWYHDSWTGMKWRAHKL